MAFSSSTTNYNLPQYQPSDKPKFLTDFNNAMKTIDTKIKSVDDKTADATQALETAETANTTANQAKTTAETANTTANQAKTTAETANAQATKNKNVLASFFDGFTNYEDWTSSD